MSSFLLLWLKVPQKEMKNTVSFAANQPRLVSLPAESQSRCRPSLNSVLVKNIQACVCLTATGQLRTVRPNSTRWYALTQCTMQSVTIQRLTGFVLASRNIVKHEVSHLPQDPPAVWVEESTLSRLLVVLSIATSWKLTRFLSERDARVNFRFVCVILSRYFYLLLRAFIFV